MASQESTYHHKVIKIVTDNPGMIVHAADIASDLNLTSRQVSDAIRRYQRRDADRGEGVGKDIKTIVHGHSYQYVPNGRVIRALRATGKGITGSDGESPNELNLLKSNQGQLALTAFIRIYFEQNPGRIVYFTELSDAVNNYYNEPFESKRILSGLNNAKSSRPTFRDQLVTVIAGQAWQYVPRGSTPAVPTRPTRVNAPTPTSQPEEPPPTPVTATQPPTTTPVPATVTTTTTTKIADDNLIMLEKLGNDANNNQLVRDVETQQLYRLMPL